MYSWISFNPQPCFIGNILISFIHSQIPQEWGYTVGLCDSQMTQSKHLICGITSEDVHKKFKIYLTLISMFYKIHCIFCNIYLGFANCLDCIVNLLILLLTLRCDTITVWLLVVRRILQTLNMRYFQYGCNN